MATNPNDLASDLTSGPTDATYDHPAPRMGPQDSAFAAAIGQLRQNSQMVTENRPISHSKDIRMGEAVQ